MGKRREPRIAAQIPVRLFGTDVEGKIFSENVTTADVSRAGVRLVGVRAQLKIDEIVGLSSGQRKTHFRVKWVGETDTPNAGCVGMLNLNPERPLWDLSFPPAIVDNFRKQLRGERRRYPRVACAVGVELRAEGEPNIWGRATDLSLGGCFVEMPIPLKLGSKFEISLWLSETKLKLPATVASTAPGYGIGVRFEEVYPQDRELLDRFIKAVTDQNRALSSAARAGRL